MQVDLRCKSCGCGPEEHIESGPCHSFGRSTRCYKYTSPLTERGLAIALVTLQREAEELREFKRLVEFVERAWPTIWHGSFSKLRESLRKRMREDDS